MSQAEHRTACNVPILRSHKHVRFHASVDVELKSSPFGDITQRRLLVGYWRFGNLESGTSETSVTNSQTTLRNIPEEEGLNRPYQYSPLFYVAPLK